MKIHKLIGIFAALSIFFGACSYNPNDYSCFATLDTNGWTDDETIVFLPEIQDSIAEGSLNVLIRHTNDYPYSNLWVEMKTALHIDTLCINLADIYGNWFGTGTGASYQLKDVALSPFVFRTGDSICIRHIMRPESISGLEQIGIIFEADEY